jgi:hypothetical protein
MRRVSEKAREGHIGGKPMVGEYWVNLVYSNVELVN